MKQLRVLIHDNLFQAVYLFVDRISPERLQYILEKIALHKASALTPAEGLRFLFQLEASFYQLKGRLAIAYGGGLHTKHRHTRYHDFFVQRVQPGENVLDIGCGNGALAYDLAQKAGGRILGIDLNPSNIVQAQSVYAHPNVNYMVGNVLQGFPQEHFDVIILSNVLEHLPRRAEFLKKIQSSCHPGRLLIRVPLFERDWQVPLKQELGVEWRLDRTHEIEYTLESFAAEMQAAQLRPIHQVVRWGEIWTEVISDGS